MSELKPNPDIEGKENNTDSDTDEDNELEDLYQGKADFLESKENLSSLIKFPTDAYNIASSTPVGTPSSSPKKTKVK